MLANRLSKYLCKGRYSAGTVDGCGFAGACVFELGLFSQVIMSLSSVQPAAGTITRPDALATSASKRSSIERVAHVTHELRGGEWFFDEGETTTESRLMRGGLFGVA